MEPDGTEIRWNMNSCEKREESRSGKRQDERETEKKYGAKGAWMAGK